MKIRGFLVTAALACAVGWAGRSVWSDDAPKAPPSDEEWAKFVAPGEEHVRLKALVGEWECTTEYAMSDGTASTEHYTASISTILGDRYLKIVLRGNMNGAPFESQETLGFDKATKKWFSLTMDTQGTGYEPAEGVELEKGKSWSFEGSYHDLRGVVSTREVISLTGPNEITWLAYINGAKTPTMTLKGTRKG